MANLSFEILTLFPQMFPGPLGESLLGRALEQGVWSVRATDIRDFATDKHKSVDDTPFGGGAGMVMRADVIDAALQSIEGVESAHKIYMSPRGRVMSQSVAKELVQKDKIIILCGRYEGVDERILQKHDFDEVSLGDFVLTGGEIPALALIDACVRLLPGVVGEPSSLEVESFGAGFGQETLLEYPHYTRPAVWDGREVPEVLRSGNHAAIEAWRLEEARKITYERRPDLVKSVDGR